MCVYYVIVLKSRENSVQNDPLILAAIDRLLEVITDNSIWIKCIKKFINAIFRNSVNFFR